MLAGLRGRGRGDHSGGGDSSPLTAQPNDAGSGGGHGLAGMRERVAIYGGRLQAGPREGGGFAVRVQMPIR
jgi:signal transduction histidine kinase